MRTTVALSMAVLVAFSMTGCTQKPVIPDIWAIYDCAMEPFNTKDLKELHVVVDRVDLHYSGIAGQEYTFGRELDLDLDVAGATDGWSVFAGEYEIPAGDYNGFTIHFAEAYGVRPNGDPAPVELKYGSIRIDRAFSTDSEDELRVIMCIKGELEKAPGIPPLAYLYDNGFSDIRFTVVEDATSGSDVHEIGELVRLPEALN